MKKQTPNDGCERVKILRAGSWEASTTQRWGDVFNPSTGRVIAQVPLCTAEEVDKVVRSAAEAQPEWAETPVVDRARVMYRFRELMSNNFEMLAQMVTREQGKTLAEARASIRRGIEMVEFACGIPSLLMGQCIDNIARNVDCETIRYPLGVWIPG